MNQNLREDAMMEEAIASAEISMETPDTEGGEKESNLIEHNGNYYVRCETHEEVIRRLQEKHEEALSSRDTYWKERVRKEVEGMRMTRIQWAGTTDEQKNALLAIFDAHNQALDALLDNLK